MAPQAKLPETPAAIVQCMTKATDLSKAKTADEKAIALIKGDAERRACAKSHLKWLDEQRANQAKLADAATTAGHPQNGSPAKSTAKKAPAKKEAEWSDTN